MRSVSWAVFLLPAAAFAADPKPERARVQVTGLFAPGRAADLRETVAAVPGVTLVEVDYEAAEVVVEFVPAAMLPGTKPDAVVRAFDGKLRAASNGTFGAKPVSAVPRDKQAEVVIRVTGLDCKGCALAAYEAVAKLDGVERATASFKDGVVTARIDPTRADRAKLEAALKQKGVKLAAP